jgi:hypothetical protein
MCKNALRRLCGRLGGFVENDGVGVLSTSMTRATDAPSRTLAPDHVALSTIAASLSSAHEINHSQTSCTVLPLVSDIKNGSCGTLAFKLEFLLSPMAARMPNGVSNNASKPSQWGHRNQHVSQKDKARLAQMLESKIAPSDIQSQRR